MRRARERTARDWEAIHARMSVGPGTEIDAVDDRAHYLEDIETLAAVARIFADDGDHRSFAQVAFFLADLLEIETDDPFVSMLAWAARGRLLHAARRLSGAAVQMIGTELRRSLTQYVAVAEHVSSEALSMSLGVTADDWLDITADALDEAEALTLADFLTDAASRAGSSHRLTIAVAQSLAGRHELAAAQFEAVITEAI